MMLPKQTIIGWVMLIMLFTNNTKTLCQEFRNFYGVCYRGKAHDNLAYARNMGYKYVFYQHGMENDTLANGLYYYIESPEYWMYNRIINTKRKYTVEEKNFYNQYCVVARPENPFPDNLATGWFFNDSCFSAELDLSKAEVRSWAIKKISAIIQKINGNNHSFKFAGLAWDVPQVTGDFWSAPQKKGGQQVTLQYWQAGATAAYHYIQGRKIYYSELFKAIRTAYPQAKIMMQPYNIYNDWLKDISSNDAAIMPDILSQEAPTLELLTDKRILKSGLTTANQLSYSAPPGNEDECLQAAGQLAVKGLWYNWFGNFGAQPDYKNTGDVPAFFSFIRAFTNWENLNHTPLIKRKFHNAIYTSPTAGFSKDMIWSVRPGTKNIYCIFLTAQGYIPYKGKALKIQAFRLDSLIGKDKEITGGLYIQHGKIFLKNTSLAGKALMIKNLRY